MKNKTLLTVLLLLLVVTASGCSSSSEDANNSAAVDQAPIPPTVEPTPVPPPLPTVAPIPGWTAYEGRGVHLWLPETYFGGNPSIDINIINQYLGQYGDPGQLAIDSLSIQLNKVLLYAFDTASSPAYISTVNITTEAIPANITMEEYVNIGVEQLPNNIVVISREQGSINGMDTVRLVIEAALPNGGTMKGAMYVLRERPTQVYAITFGTTPEEFDARAAGYQQAVRTFRTDLMLQQSGTLPDAAGGPTPTPAGLILSDQFDNDMSGWSTQNDELASVYYSESSYHFYIYDIGSLAWSVRGEYLEEDVVVEVDTWTAISQPDETVSELGVLCGFQDNTNFYFMAIRSDGHFAIFQMTSGGERMLGAQVWMSHPAINTGSTPNRLTAECVGHTLRFSVNGQLLEETTTPTPLTGQVGLFSGNFQGVDSHAIFDNFLVRAP